MFCIFSCCCCFGEGGGAINSFAFIYFVGKFASRLYLCLFYVFLAGLNEAKISA